MGISGFKQVIRVACVCFGVLAANHSVFAAIVEGLYEAEVPVVSQSNDEHNRAMSEALAEVIVKVSGDAKAPSLEGVAAAMQKSSQYVQQFRYGRIPSNYFGKIDSSATRLAWFRFDENAVNRLLHDNGLPVWGRTRPTTLAWIAIEQDGARFILGGDANDDLKAMLQFNAKRRGLALLLPLMDLEDQRKLTFADLWGEFQTTILAASARYQADAVLVGKLFLTPSDDWQVTWSLFENGRHLRWQGQYPQIGDAMKIGVAGSLEILAKRYAQVYAENQPSEMVLSVDGVSNLEDFARLTDYLKSLEQVKGVNATRINQHSVDVHLDLRGNPEGLRQTIGLGNVLAVAQVHTIPQETQAIDLVGSANPDEGLGSNPVNEAVGAEFHYTLLP